MSWVTAQVNIDLGWWAVREAERWRVKGDKWTVFMSGAIAPHLCW